MKKQYKKPSIFIEDFTISQYIAGSCASSGYTTTKTYYREGCYIDIDGNGTTRIFDNSSCNMTEKDLNDEYCYHGPIDVNKYFGS